MTSVLYSPITLSASALSYASPTLPTEGSMPALLVPFPKPRMKKLALTVFCRSPTRNEGTTLLRSLMSRTCARSIVSAGVTDTATGTSCRLCARFVAVTNGPSVINLYEDLGFIFGTPHDFKNRFSGEPDYFANKGEQKGLLLETNFVADSLNLPLISAKERGAGGGHIRFNMAKGSMNSHISQFPVGTYNKAHAHGPGAHVIIMRGEGYSLMWPEGEEPRRYPWHGGSMIVPPNCSASMIVTARL